MTVASVYGRRGLSDSLGCVVCPRASRISFRTLSWTFGSLSEEQIFHSRFRRPLTFAHRIMNRSPNDRVELTVSEPATKRSIRVSLSWSNPSDM